MRLHPELRHILSLLQPGWEVQGRNGSGHVKLLHTTGAQLVLPAVPTDIRRCRGNALRDERRALHGKNPHAR